MQKSFRIPSMVLQREDLREWLGDKCDLITDKSMRDIVEVLGDCFMNDWVETLDYAIDRTSNEGRIKYTEAK